ncbi:MAG TPA: fibronectin type III domain-containing protein [Candidatus Sulfotelmatobacter sp.]|nr:fibronectin type III domain-containing protein [Candidatus Sulfotelmatobacter sp.]
MNMVSTALAIVLALGGFSLMKVAEQEVSPAAAQTSAPSPGQSIQQLPAPAPVSPIGTASNAVQITNGPVVESITDTTAQIAWSTNVNAGTMLRYGADQGHLDQAAGMPWGGLTHRVTIKDLKPNTTYYFQAESSQGQGTGTQAQTGQSSFQTKPAGVQESRK